MQHLAAQPEPPPSTCPSQHRCSQAPPDTTAAVPSPLQVATLEPGQVNLLMRWVLELLGRYTASGLFLASLHSVKAVAAQRQAEQVKDLRAVLALLNHLTQRDVVDSLEGGGGQQQGGGEQPVDVAQVGAGLWLPCTHVCCLVCGSAVLAPAVLAPAVLAPALLAPAP